MDPAIISALVSATVSVAVVFAAHGLASRRTRADRRALEAADLVSFLRECIAATVNLKYRLEAILAAADGALDHADTLAELTQTVNAFKDRVSSRYPDLKVDDLATSGAYDFLHNVRILSDETIKIVRSADCGGDLVLGPARRESLQRCQLAIERHLTGLLTVHILLPNDGAPRSPRAIASADSLD